MTSSTRSPVVAATPEFVDTYWGGEYNKPRERGVAARWHRQLVRPFGGLVAPMAIMMGPSAQAADWQCRTANGGTCEYGFGPRCQPHAVCPCPQQTTCKVAQTGNQEQCPPNFTPSAEFVCSAPAGIQPVCDANATQAAPAGVLCCVSIADCPTPAAYGSPATTCGTLACNGGYCVPEGPAQLPAPVTADAASQPCCLHDSDCHTTQPCITAMCGADWHCHALLSAGCCTPNGPYCSGGQTCQVAAGDPDGKCTNTCAIDDDCKFADCRQRECKLVNSVKVCVAKTNASGNPLPPIANCCRNQADCAPLSGDARCTTCVLAAGAKFATCQSQASTGCCTNPNDCALGSAPYTRRVCAACTGDCAGCLDDSARADNRCQNCTVPACKVAGSVCAASYLTLATSCTDATGDKCTAADKCTKCDTGTGTCVAKVCQNGPCKIGTCDAGSGVCSFADKPNGNVCTDGNVCTFEDYCVVGSCTGTTVSCNDNNAGTADYCGGASGEPICHHMPLCDDLNACTLDSLGAQGCTHQAAPDDPPIACDDGKPCTTGEGCSNGACMAVSGGDRLFSKTFGNVIAGTSTQDSGRAVAVQTGAGFAVAGQSTAAGIGRAWMVHTTPTGDEICNALLSVPPKAPNAPPTASKQWATGVAVVTAGCAPNQPCPIAVAGRQLDNGAEADRAFVAWVSGSPVGMPICGQSTPTSYDNTFGGGGADYSEEFVAVTAMTGGLLLGGMATGPTGKYPWLLSTNGSGAANWSYIDGPAPDAGFGSGDTVDASVVVQGMAIRGNRVVLVGTSPAPFRAWMAIYTLTPGGAVPLARSATWTSSQGLGERGFAAVAFAPNGDIVAVGYRKNPADAMNEDILHMVFPAGFPAPGVAPVVTTYGKVGYAANNWERAYGVAVFGDGSELIVGEESMAGIGYAIRLGPDGKELWTRRFGPTTLPDAKALYAVVPSSVSSGVIAGVVQGQNDLNYVLMAIDVGGNLTCANSGTCFEQPAVGKQGSDVCQDYVCKQSVWQLVNNKGPCSDGKPCTYGDACANGVCVPGESLALGAGCDDGNECTGGDQCTAQNVCAGQNVFGSPICAATQGPCRVGSCQGANTTKVCVPNLQNGVACISGNPCSVGETCLNGECTNGTAVPIPATSIACGINATCAGTACMAHR